MYTQSVVYANDNGGISILYPAPECGLTLEQIAFKDVPHGKPFRYINNTDLPEDYTFLEAFEVDFSTPDGHGGDWGNGSKNVVIGWNSNGTPITEWRDE
jgi:hypothetical protein